MNEVKAGLATTTGEAIPLQGVEVQGEVLGGHAQVKVRQRYKNAEPKPVEAVYTFPLPSDATLTGFSMTCDGRRVEGVVKEREQAFRDYDDAISAGHGAALLDQERPNVFTAQVGNLLPGEETLVEVEYVQRLQADEGTLRWSIPTLVAPRYIPGAPTGDRSGHGWAEPTDQVPDADRITPPLARQVDYGLKLDLLFDLGRAVEVESPSHAIQITKEGSRVRVAFAQREVALDRDVVVTARGVEEGPLTTVVTHRGETGPGTVALTVVPDLFDSKKDGSAQEVVFVIDTSGSMEGASITEARAALRLCLRHLREGDRFNVVAFENSYRTFSPQLVPFTQRTLEQADRWVEALHASGGTEMLAPLLFALQSAPDGVVVLLTDGQVGNEDELLRRALETRKKARVYSFGIGTNVSDALLRGLAQRTGGAVEFIQPGERIDEKVVAQFSRAVAARVTDVAIKFDGLDVGELAPAELPALVDGEPWVLFGRYDAPGSGTVEIRGTLRGGPFLLKVPVSLPASAAHPHVPKLWAAERIRDLEVAQLTGRRAEAMKDRITKLAAENQISSRYTSFVVVEKRTGERRASGQPETRVVPVNLPAGWAMFDRDKDTSRVMPVGGAMTTLGAPRNAPARPPMVPLSPPPPPAPMPAGPMPVYAQAAPAPAAKVVAKPSPAKMLKEAAADLFRARGSKGGLVDKAKKEDDAVRREIADRVLSAESFESGGLDDLAAPAAEVDDERPAPPGPGGLDPVTALLGTQLANGLWAEPGSEPEEVRQVRATARALLKLLEAGVTTSHALHGAQVKKAVEALLAQAKKVAAKQPELAELALGVAWLIASGRRTRGEIEKTASAEPPLSGMKPYLGDEGRTRQRVDELNRSLLRP